MDITGIGSIADLATTAINKIWPDKTAQEMQAMADQFAIIKGQLDANTASAAQPGFHFRDGAGWVCVFGMAVALCKPMIEWAGTLAGHPIVLPAMDTSTTSNMLYALLGLGGMHVAERIKGAA